MASQYSIADPKTSANEAALQLTEMQLQEAVQLAGPNTHLIGALLTALAINRQTVLLNSQKHS